MKQAEEGSVEMVKLMVSGRETERACARAGKSAVSLAVAVRNVDVRQEGGVYGSIWMKVGLERMWGEVEKGRRQSIARAWWRERAEGKWTTLKLLHMQREREWIRECSWTAALSCRFHKWEGTAAEWWGCR